MLNSIPRVSAGYRAQTVDQLKGDFTQGTRKGLFKELELWSDGHFPEDVPKRLYFLNGGAGLGKSAITHQLCARLNESPGRPPRVSASYFFVRGDRDLSSGHSLFPTLLHQLALSQPTLRPHIIAAVREYLQHSDEKNIGYASKDLLREVLLEASSSDHSPVFLIVDGLDECRERDLLPQLLRSLLELVREVPCLRVFAASRPEPHIMAVLAAPEARDVVHSRSLDDTLDELKGDVKLYLEETIPRIPSYAAYLRRNPDALERLSIRAAGVFIYARTAVRFLEAYRDHPEEQFELLFSSGGASWLSPIDALYLQVLRSAFPPKDLRQAQPARQERLLSLLQVLVLNMNSGILRLSCIALLGPGLSEDDVTSMVDSLRSVLFINKDGKVTPLHATFREFLVDKDRCVDSLYHVDAGKGHARLASACLAAFSVRNATEYLANPSSAVGRYVYYAALRWGSHLEDAESDTELENRFRTFLQGGPQVIYQMVLRRIGISNGIHHLSIDCMARFLKVSNQPFSGIHWSCLVQAMLIHIDIALQASGQAKMLYSEYAKFSAYSNCWYWEVGRNPDTPLDQLAPDMESVTQELSKYGELNLLHDVRLDFTLQHTDMERYQAAHAALAGEICQDERTREVWFPKRFRAPSRSKRDRKKTRKRMEKENEDREGRKKTAGEEDEER